MNNFDKMKKNHLRAPELLGPDDHLGEPRVEREGAHQPPQLRDRAAVLPHRAQQGQVPHGAVDGVRGRPLQVLELGHVLHPDAEHLEYDGREVAAQNLGRRVHGKTVELL